jgi:hypothetical protein
VLGDPRGGTRTRRKQYASFCKHHAFVSFVEPTTIYEALGEADWILAMQDELNNFTRNQVWELVESPKNKNVIGTKWVYRNKQDEHVIVVKNKARLVAKGYCKVEGLDYGGTFAPVARLEAIRILLAYAYSHKMKLFQMDVKSAFLNGFINEDVYVEIGRVDNTLFTKIINKELFICQIYVDDIIFGSTNLKVCKDFSERMTREFEMSMIGELNFFLGFQIK